MPARRRARAPRRRRGAPPGARAATRRRSRATTRRRAARYGPDDDPWPAFRACSRRARERVRELLLRPVQTNEVGRSACLLGGFATVARETGLPLRLLRGRRLRRPEPALRPLPLRERGLRVGRPRVAGAAAGVFEGAAAGDRRTHPGVGARGLRRRRRSTRRRRRVGSRCGASSGPTRSSAARASTPPSRSRPGSRRRSSAPTPASGSPAGSRREPRLGDRRLPLARDGLPRPRGRGALRRARARGGRSRHAARRPSPGSTSSPASAPTASGSTSSP